MIFKKTECAPRFDALSTVSKILGVTVPFFRFLEFYDYIRFQSLILGNIRFLASKVFLFIPVFYSF